MFDFLSTKCPVPADLDAVTTARPDDEVDPREVGLDADAPEKIWESVRSYYATGIHPAIQICLRRHGQIILHRAIGYASGNGPHDAPKTRKVLCTTETPFNIFSASKAVTAMMIHALDERGLLRVDDPVCEYIPEFARHKKQWITIRHLLTHRAGIPNLPAAAMDLDNLHRPGRVLEILCDLKPSSRAGRTLAYHAMTGGFLLGEIAQRVTGNDLRSLITKIVRQPLGMRWLNYGVPAADVRRVARNEFTGPPPLPPFSFLLRNALGVDFQDAARLANDERFLTALVPAGNLVCTAEELSRFYQTLLNGGELDGVRVFEPRTIRRATLEQTYREIDVNLGLPFRYSLGFMLGADYLSIYGPDTRHAFGHLGFSNIVSWADRDRQLAGTIMSSGKPLIYPEIYQAWNMMRQIGVLCPKTKPRHAAPLKRPRRARAHPG